MLGAGKLKEQIAISTPTSVSDGAGGFETTFTPILTTYAEVTPVSVSNDLIAQGADIIDAYNVKIRYRQDVFIKKGDRLIWRGRVCEIIGLPPGMINKEFIKIIVKTSNTTTDATL